MGAHYTARSRSAAVAQSRGEAVDGEMDRAPGAGIGVAGAIAAQELDLQVIERVEIGKAVADAARERGIVLEQRRLTRDGEEMAQRERVLVANAGEYCVTHAGIGNELRVARADREVGLREHHAEVRKRRAEERPALVHFGEQRKTVRRAGEPGLDRRSEAVPTGQHQAALAPREDP